MTAASDRAALAAIGRDLVSLGGDAGERRAAALASTPSAAAPASFSELSAVPDWLRLPREDQSGIARRAALLAMAPALATSIDGTWLRDLATFVGDDGLDSAIAQAHDIPGDGLPAVPASALEATGFALMRAALPDALAGYLDWAETVAFSPDPALARFCVSRAIVVPA